MSSASARNGKAFEHAVLVALESAVPGVNLEVDADVAKGLEEAYSRCPARLQSGMDSAATAAVELVIGLNKSFQQARLKRLPDGAGREGIVADVVLYLDTASYYLSIKWNHAALKHNRPPSLIQALGHSRHSPKDVAYREALKAALEPFRTIGAAIGATRFSDFTTQQRAKLLYRPVLEVGCEHLRSAGPAECRALFRFLQGQPHLKLIAWPKERRVDLLDLRDVVREPSSVVPRIHDDRHLHLKFDNGLIADCRIHSAAGAIAYENPSLKFDVQALGGLPVLASGKF